MTEQSQIPSGAQLKRDSDAWNKAVATLSKSFALRIKAVELAASFDSKEPMKLIKEIYEFLSDEL